MKPPFSKLYAKHFLFLLLGALPIAFIWNVENRWIAMPVGILAVLFILLQLHIINNIADQQLAWARSKKSEEEAMLPAKEPASPLKQKVVWYATLFVFCFGVLSIPITGKKVENYIEWTPILLDLLKLIWIPFVIAWWYQKQWKIVFSDKEKEDYVLLYVFLIPLFVLFNGTVWYNHLQPSSVIAQEKIAVTDKGSNARYGTKYIFLTIKGKTKRFEIPQKLHKQIQPNDTLLITTKKGALGYTYIDRFERLQKEIGNANGNKRF